MVLPSLWLVTCTLACGFEQQQDPQGAAPQAGRSASADVSVSAPAAYILGRDDQIVIRALHAPEISEKPVRIGPDGFITLPLIGRTRALGLTVHDFETAINARLAAYIQDPEASVSVLEFKSQPVSVLGAVKSPGVRQLESSQTVLDLLSAAGGLDADAGYSVTITRRLESGAIPLAGARSDPSGSYSVAELNLPDLMEGRAPLQNVLARPHDVITVPRAKLVYVIGEVHKAGGFVLRDQEGISVLQVLSLAEGLQRTAGPEHARIIRPRGAGLEKEEIAVNLKQILAGKEPDQRLRPNDILFVPNSAARSVAMRSVEAAIQLGTGVVIWRR